MGLLDKLFGKKEAPPAEERSSAIEPESPARDPVSSPVPLQPEASLTAPTPLASPLLSPEEVSIKAVATEVDPVSVELSSSPHAGEISAQSQPVSIEQMRSDPNFVRVFDQYGQEVFLTRQQWRDEILPASLQANWSAPDELYGVLLNAMNDGLFAEIEAAAAHLHATDTNAVRGTCMYAIVLLQLGRIDEAEHVLNQYLKRSGEEGAVLTNLAKVYAERGETERAHKTLWRAIELDPNLENGLGWYLATEFERGGEEARRAGIARVAALPGSWRARLWLAKMALEGKDLAGALALYREGLDVFRGPVPTEFLYPMSGDLGLSGHLRELVDMTEPLFLPELHGLPVGNNLIKAHADLGEIDAAAAIVNRLFAMKRPDWRETLGFWDNALAQARHADRPQRDADAALEIGMLEMTGPVWKRSGGALAEVFGDKPDTAPVVTLLGGTADFTPAEGQQGMQLADALGRLSRAFPLFLAEQIEFGTAARARTLLPRVTSGGAGFVLRGGEWTEVEAMEAATEAELTPDIVLKAHITAAAGQWGFRVTAVRANDSAPLGVLEAHFPAGRPEEAVLALSQQVLLLLERNGLAREAPPAFYRLPEGPALANYMIRLEQLLALRSAVTAEDEAPVISGEREILEGTLGLALQQPRSPAVRAVLAAVVVAMRRLRPEIVDEFTDRFTMLQRDQPLGEPLDEIVLDMVTD